MARRKIHPAAPEDKRDKGDVLHLFHLVGIKRKRRPLPVQLPLRKGDGQYPPFSVSDRSPLSFEVTTLSGGPLQLRGSSRRALRSASPTLNGMSRRTMAAYITAFQPPSLYAKPEPVIPSQPPV